jgi:hypothetical protein
MLLTINIILIILTIIYWERFSERICMLTITFIYFGLVLLSFLIHSILRKSIHIDYTIAQYNLFQKLNKENISLLHSLLFTGNASFV